MQCSDALLYQYILEENEARLKIVFEVATDALSKLQSDIETMNNIFSILKRLFKLESQRCGIAFEKAGGLDIIEKLQTHANEQIRNQSSVLLVENFEMD